MSVSKLAPCPNKPNCVCSTDSDAEHKIEPFPIKTNVAQSLSKLKNLILNEPRTEIVESTGTYLHAVYTTAIMRFKDDVEFLVDEKAKNIQVRSASRVGHSDLGVNRKRVEALRKAYLES
jgi:uncharacterized protein (DUF1499 family)